MVTNMKVTMKEIAEKLNISINAVSIALNDKVGVSDEMRLRILRTADELGYINHKREYLSVFSKSNICVMMQSYYANTGHFYSTVLQSIIDEAKLLGYFSILSYFEDNQFSIPESVEERKVAGIIVIGKISEHNLTVLSQMAIPIVLVDYTSLGIPLDCVLTHNKQGGYMMCNYLIERGYRKIGFFGDLDYSFSFQDRFWGYRESLLKNKIVRKENIDEYIQKYSFLKDIESFVLSHQEDEIKRILQSKELPEVLICANDSNAYLVIKVLKKIGLKVPDDIGVVGFDDTPLCTRIIPAITTIQVQKELMGVRAVSNLVDRIHRKDNIPVTSLLSVKIVERKSIK